MFQDGFPGHIKNDVFTVIKQIPLITYGNISIGSTEQTIKYFINCDEVVFPSRIYYTDVSEEVVTKFSYIQEMILHCIYSRSCDGYIRQKHMQQLLTMDYPEWAIPYIVKLCDEYVVEILEMIYALIKKQDLYRFKYFCFENGDKFVKSYSRMTSYWNEYYRYIKFDNYVGKKLFWECFGYSRSTEKQRKSGLDSAERPEDRPYCT